MINPNVLSKIKEAFYIVLVSLLGVLSIVFSILYIDTFNSGFFLEYKKIVVAIAVTIISLLSILCLIFLKNDKKILFRLIFLTVIVITASLILIYILKVTGFLEKVQSIDKFREYVTSFGAFAIALFILIQFLQVVVLPIPSFVTVGAGVLLFGAFKGAIFSVIGIITGSVLAFFIGRIFGFKVAKWLVGQENLSKGLKAVEGKDKIVLTFMFLFPFFPDDVLCFVAGITTMSPLFFISMIFIVRIITVFASSYSMNNSIIPYDTWWGILLWIVFFAFTVVCSMFIYKYGEKIEKFFTKNKKSRK